MTFGVALLALLALLYVLAGYPLLLLVLAKAPAVSSAAITPRVSIVIAIHNGASWIREKLTSLAGLQYPPEMLDLILVLDGCTDGTESLVASSSCPFPVTVLSVSRCGKSAAINHGVAAATGELLFLTDVRQRVDRDCLTHLVAPFADSSVGCVTGELVLTAEAGSPAAGFGFYWRFETWMRERLSDVDALVGVTGCVYAIRRKLFQPLPADLILDDVLVPIRVSIQGFRVLLERRARVFDTLFSAGNEFQRKVRTQAGIYQLLLVAPEVWSARYRRRFHFFSYKVGRLLLPFFLIAILLTAPFLDGPLQFVLLAGQAALYGCALLGRLIRLPRPVRAVFSACYAFVVLAAAALVAVQYIGAPAAAAWKSSSGSQTT